MFLTNGSNRFRTRTPSLPSLIFYSNSSFYPRPTTSLETPVSSNLKRRDTCLSCKLLKTCQITFRLLRPSLSLPSTRHLDTTCWNTLYDLPVVSRKLRDILPSLLDPPRTYLEIPYGFCDRPGSHDLNFSCTISIGSMSIVLDRD